jgi:single-strand DNA-binding protein
VAESTNIVVLVGRLTRDPELRSTNSGHPVCSMRLAWTTRRKAAGGEWEDKSNFIDVTVWGKHGENCATYLAKGRPCAVKGRLEWREYEDRDGNTRQVHEIIADNVEFLSSGDGNGRRGPEPDEGSFTTRHEDDFTPQSEVPADTSGFAPADAGPPGPDDDIPF